MTKEEYDSCIESGTRCKKYNEYFNIEEIECLKNKPIHIMVGNRKEYTDLKKRNKLKKILILIIIIETFTYLVLSQIIIFKNSNTIKENEKLIKELEENRNILITENSYLKIQNMNLWEYYYTNNSK